MLYNCIVPVRFMYAFFVPVLSITNPYILLHTGDICILVLIAK